MRKKILLFFVFCNIFVYGQIQDAWVYFGDMAQYYMENPLQMLSQRALDRRSNQNITLDISDVQYQKML